MRVLKAATISLVLITGSLAALARSATPEHAASKLTQQVIIGPWRLVGIDYSGPNDQDLHVSVPRREDRRCPLALPGDEMN